MKKTQLVACIVVMFAVKSVSAISVTWGPAQSINSNDDIINPSNIIRAVNIGNDNVTVPVVASGISIDFVSNVGVSGGTNFKNDSFFVDDNPALGVVLGDTNSEFHRVLDSFRDNGNTNVLFDNLTPGETYYLQVFQSDDRGNRNVAWSINGVGVAFSSNSALFRSVYTIAEVVLDGGETSFTLNETGGQINAAVLSQAPVPVPEPATFALLGLTGVALLGRSRGTRRVV